MVPVNPVLPITGVKDNPNNTIIHQKRHISKDDSFKDLLYTDMKELGSEDPEEDIREYRKRKET